MALEQRLAATSEAAAAVADARVEMRAIRHRVEEEARSADELHRVAAAERVDLEGVAELLSKERDSLTEMARQLQVTTLQCAFVCLGVASSIISYCIIWPEMWTETLHRFRLDVPAGP